MYEKQKKMKFNDQFIRDFRSLIRLGILVHVLLCYLIAPVKAYGQEDLASLKLKNIKMIDAIKAVEKACNYKFVYNNNEVNVDREITVNTENKNAETIVREIFAGYNITVENNTVIVSPSKTSINNLNSTQQSSRKRTITGKVVDAENEEPLIGVTVRLKGTSTGVVTDIDGNYSITINNKNDVLEFSYIGYLEQEMEVDNLAIIDVEMKTDNTQLDEVVVVGAGVQEKVSVTGAITSVQGKSLRMPSSSLTNAFAGQLAGVISMTTSGTPGAVSEFYIRGISTFGGRATPLIMLDDVEISAHDLNNIPAETIESFSILKDASATAIYGSRGANGVMLVKTKTGNHNERTKINVNLDNSINAPMNFPEFVDGATWMELYNEALLSRSPKANPRYSQ
ncbi:MAG: carboxypeptidase-like regulatory domain-containing protein [Dysgonamonadaceae bacterium]|nr:carboxypeptidase-like regulatory domain-containing protein [Dysgonamonadaceae bacterium]